MQGDWEALLRVVMEQYYKDYEYVSSENRVCWLCYGDHPSYACEVRNPFNKPPQGQQMNYHQNPPLPSKINLEDALAKLATSQAEFQIEMRSSLRNLEAESRASTRRLEEPIGQLAMVVNERFKAQSGMKNMEVEKEIVIIGEAGVVVEEQDAILDGFQLEKKIPQDEPMEVVALTFKEFVDKIMEVESPILIDNEPRYINLSSFNIQTIDDLSCMFLLPTPERVEFVEVYPLIAEAWKKFGEHANCAKEIVLE